MSPELMDVLSAKYDGIHVLNESWLDLSLSQGRKLKEEEYLIEMKKEKPPQVKFKKPKVMKVNLYQGDPSAPKFPSEHQIFDEVVLQVTDFQSNFNKYYSLEFHFGNQSGKEVFRVFSHYGRTDDLEKNPNSGRKECRYYPDFKQAAEGMRGILEEKMGPAKGYKPIQLQHSNIGSDVRKAKAKAKAKTTAPSSSGEEESGEEETPKSAKDFIPSEKSGLHPALQILVNYLFSEAATALASSIAAKITSRGIETPLGILRKDQIEQGDAVLMEMYELLSEEGEDAAHKEGSLRQKLRELSGKFFTIIPHRIGRSKMEVEKNIIDTFGILEAKQELLQLMKDLLEVTSEGAFQGGGVGGKSLSVVEMQFKALKNEIFVLNHDSRAFQEIRDYALATQTNTDRFVNKTIEVVNIFALGRGKESEAYSKQSTQIHPQKLLFHGSRISNWVGLLSRGILMPKIIVRAGGKRTDAGLLGNGIYFAGSSSASAQYATEGELGTRFLLCSRVAVGRSKDYRETCMGITEPPNGYDSVRGVPKSPGDFSVFHDEEIVVFDPARQKQEYFIEFKLHDQPLSSPLVSGASIDPRSPSEYLIDDPGCQLSNPSASSSHFKMRTSAPASTLTHGDDLFSVSGPEMSRSAVEKPSTPKAQLLTEPRVHDSPFTASFSTFSETPKTHIASDAPVDPFRQSISEFKSSNESESGLVVDEYGMIKSSSSERKSSPTLGGSSSAPLDPFRQSIAEFKSSSESESGLVVDEYGMIKSSSDRQPLPTVGGSSSVTVDPFRQSIAEFKSSNESESGLVVDEYGMIKSAPREPIHFENAAPLRSPSPPMESQISRSLPFPSSSASLPDQLAKEKADEDYLRKLFVSDRYSSTLQDAYVHLIDIWANQGSFKGEALTPEEEEIPLLLSEGPSPYQVGEKTIVEKEAFRQRWNQFTQGVLDKIDWKGVFVAGGAVLRCLEKRGDISTTESSDVDLFFYGLSELEAQDKVDSIFQVVKDTVQDAEIIRTKNAITILGKPPFRHIQIILRMYTGPAEVLMGFDIDSCTFGFDGEKVWTLPRGRRALNKRYNLVDLSRRSLTYEYRLQKYSKRGFGVRIPNYQPDRVQQGLFSESRLVKDVSGLARLVLMDHRSKFPVSAPKKNSKVQGEDGKEDYILIFVPWGPSPRVIVKSLEARDRNLFFSKKSIDPMYDGHLVVCGLDAVFSGKPEWCRGCRGGGGLRMALESSKDLLSGPLSWLKENPGQQGGGKLDMLSGSFHPLSSEEWETDAYKDYVLEPGTSSNRGFPTKQSTQVSRKAISHPKTSVPSSSFQAKPAAPLSPKSSSPSPASFVVSPSPWQTPQPTQLPDQPTTPVSFSSARTLNFAGSSVSGSPFAPASISTPSKPPSSLSATSQSSSTPSLPEGSWKCPCCEAINDGGKCKDCLVSKPTTPSSSAPFRFGSAPTPTPTSSLFTPSHTPTPTSSLHTPSPAPSPALSIFAPSPTPKSSLPSVTTQEIEKVFDQSAPKTPFAKLLLVISLLTKGGLLSSSERDVLKNLVISNDENLVCALEVFEIQRDFDELADTLKEVASFCKSVF
eukprot:CAMPEP_0201480894 /NCGR_PEP_ID=MMETSP0151_2-20130828/5266_1 /ASSEMBLY_ACC=CAM_ASM_000257 /TAXON_ID=200890 /ORGANISM="Paramoeba atlantica, Strain 621/1 / CCAP 1560/9" /LENGTH=1568 /DNA_ID=CAMNT_0047862883 /DNA_START=283 /DNA_END=4989 /DNA_ORIENTATION=+